MKITICSSLSFAKELGEFAEKLEKRGHSVFLPKTFERALKGEFSMDFVLSHKTKIALQNNAMLEHFEKIKKSDAILVLNFDKKGVKNYVGGAVFLEMGFAFVLGKKVFMLNEIPELSYSDEIRQMKPVILGNDLGLIK